MRATAVSPWIASGWTLLRWFSLLLLGMTAPLCLGGPMALGQAQAQPAKAHAAPATAAAAKSLQPTARPTAPAASERTPGGPHEGIQVHGHWVIEVKNPDGRLVSHSEFENSLQLAGQDFLALLLSGYTPGDWEILLDGPTGQEPCLNSLISSGQSPCFVVEKGGYFLNTLCPGTGNQCFPTLQVTNPLQGTTLRNVVTMTGTATAGSAGMISNVKTVFEICYPSSTPAACQTGTGGLTNGDFTAVTLPTTNTPSTPCGGTGQPSCAVPVAAGQTINASVTISFQ